MHEKIIGKNREKGEKEPQSEKMTEKVCVNKIEVKGGNEHAQKKENNGWPVIGLYEKDGYAREEKDKPCNKGNEEQYYKI